MQEHDFLFSGDLRLRKFVRLLLPRLVWSAATLALLFGAAGMITALCSWIWPAIRANSNSFYVLDSVLWAVYSSTGVMWLITAAWIWRRVWLRARSCCLRLWSGLPLVIAANCAALSASLLLEGLLEHYLAAAGLVMGIMFLTNAAICVFGGRKWRSIPRREYWQNMAQHIGCTTCRNLRPVDVSECPCSGFCLPGRAQVKWGLIGVVSSIAFAYLAVGAVLVQMSLLNRGPRVMAARLHEQHCGPLDIASPADGVLVDTDFCTFRLPEQVECPDLQTNVFRCGKATITVSELTLTADESYETFVVSRRRAEIRPQNFWITLFAGPLDFEGTIERQELVSRKAWDGWADYDVFVHSGTNVGAIFHAPTVGRTSRFTVINMPETGTRVGFPTDARTGFLRVWNVGAGQSLLLVLDASSREEHLDLARAIVGSFEFSQVVDTRDCFPEN